jgi:hypothetical protein
VFASLAIAALVTLTSLLGLLTSWPYQQETQNWTLQARGQDIGNLIAVVVLIVSTIRMRDGSFRATQLWIGTLFYLLYAYVIYAFAVHFGRLFLVYVAILSLVVYTLIAALRSSARPSGYPLGATHVFAAWVPIGTGALFTLLWLSELVPASMSGQLSPSTAAAGLIVNPVHVIDLSYSTSGRALRAQRRSVRCPRSLQPRPRLAFRNLHRSPVSTTSSSVITRLASLPSWDRHASRFGIQIMAKRAITRV